MRWTYLQKQPWLLTLKSRFAASDWHCVACVEQSGQDAPEPMLRVWHCGRLRLPRGQIDTDIAVRLEDITEPKNGVLDILSADKQYRAADSAVFFYRVHNGIIPFKKAVLRCPLPVCQIPLRSLLFARRGWRKINVVLTLLDRTNETVLAQTSGHIEIVCELEGFLEKQQRYANVLRACAALALAVMPPNAPAAAQRLRQWLERAAQTSTLPDEIQSLLSSPAPCKQPAAINEACQAILAYGQPTDAMTALELCFEMMALSAQTDAQAEAAIWQMAEILQIRQQDILTLAQKRFLESANPQAQWRLLLGLREPIDPETLRRHLTEEYRRWNARVTNHDPRVRQNAETMLSLIAALRCQAPSYSANSA